MVKYNYCYWLEVARVADAIPHKGKLHNCSVLITGPTGMICSAVVDMLHWMNKSHHSNIHVILSGRSEEKTYHRFPYIANDHHFTFITYDSTNSLEIPIEADYIIHGASNADPTSIACHPVDTMLSNIVGLNTLLKSAVKNNSKRLLLISSSEVYGKIEKKVSFREGDYGYVDILNPRASYPCSKRAAETLCAAYREEFGLDFVTIRPGHIYGPSIKFADSRASAQFTRNAKEGKDIVMKSAGTQLRSYCHTLDCASAILTVLLSGKSGEAYNISSKGLVCTIRDVAEAFAKAGGVEVIFENPTTKEKKSYNMMENSSLEGSKLEALGWKPFYDLSVGATKTLLYYEL